MSREKNHEEARNSLGVGQETLSSVSKQSNKEKEKRENKLKITENKTEDKTEDKQEIRGPTMLDNFLTSDYCQTLAQLVKKPYSNQMAKFEEIFRFRQARNTRTYDVGQFSHSRLLSNACTTCQKALLQSNGKI